MDDLRLILLIIGALAVLAVYVWTRYQSQSGKPKARHVNRASPANSRTEAPDEGLIQQELERMQQVMGDADVPPAVASAVPEEEVLVISVVAAPDQPFHGEALHKALSNNKLVFGDKAIFHRLVRQAGDDVPVFSVANLFKPGDFGNGELHGFTTLGITLFLQLPAPIDALKAFDDFVQTAERLAVELGGQLQDQKHCVITHQSLMLQREKLAGSNRRHTPPVS